MGIYDRDYARPYQDQHHSMGSGFKGMPPVVKWLLIINFAVFMISFLAFPDLIPENQKKARQGLTFQIITPIVFSDKFFVQLTPVFSMNDFDDENQDRFAQEIFLSYSIQPTLQLTGFFRGNFEDEVYTYRLGLTVFL